MKKPTITVVIPCYNSGRYINEAVESVKMQRGNFTLDSIIIVNDGSDDPETLKAFDELRKIPKVKIVPNRFCRGPAGARNSGIEMVESQWLAFLDADDLLTPNSFGARIDALSHKPEVKWCGGDFVKFNSDSSDCTDPVYRSGQKHSLAFERYNFDRPLLIETPIKYFLKKMITWMGAVLIRTDVLKDCNGFKEDLLQSEDNNLFIRIALKHDFLFVPDVVLAKREHDASLTRQNPYLRKWAIRNFRSLLKDPAFKPHRQVIRNRLKLFYKNNAAYHLEQRQPMRYFNNMAWHAYYKAWKYISKP